jgi:hypothetical protein
LGGDDLNAIRFRVFSGVSAAASLSDPLDPTQKAARSRRMDIDVIGAAISQSTIQQPLDIGAVAYVA